MQGDDYDFFKHQFTKPDENLTAYFKEVKISKESLRTIKVPKRILKAEDGVVDIAVGGSFAVCRADFQEIKLISKQSSVEKKLSTMDLKFTDSN